MTAHRPHHTPELLAPAGGRDALVAAAANGADAVYAGLKDLNARRGAPNFTIEELAEATRYAHLRGVRVYLTANIVVLAEEMQRAMTTVDDAWTAGVDAVIVQDLGLLELLSRELPHVRLHASTQMNAHNTASVAALADLGVARVTLARETSVAEIAAMAASSGVEVESFVHGALCFCYSGQCLMSSIIGARSANRGLCAQPCRMAYRLVGADGREADCPGEYLLSPRDLAGITLLPQLVASGVAALKIEGRMKRPEYVALVTGVYRAALDRAAADPDGFAVMPAEWATLEEAFNRGFTEGSLSGRRGEERMSWRRPNNRGVLVGRVVTSGGGRATIALDRALDATDTIEVWTSRGRFAQKAGELAVGERNAPHAPAGSRAMLAMEGVASAGDRVFRVVNASLLDAARRTFTGEERRRVPIDLAVRLKVGEPLSLTATATGFSATVTAAEVEPARTKRVTAEEVMEHVGRLGGTPYEASSWSLELDPAAGIGFSSLHAARRAAIEKLDAARLAQWTSRTPARPPAPKLPPAPRAAKSAEPTLVAAVDSLETAHACLAAGADRVLLAVAPSDAVESLPPRVEALLPRIAHDDEMPALLAWADGGDVTTGNLGLLKALAGQGSPVAADWGLNVVNPWTAEALAGLGARMVWASPELSGRQLAALSESSPLPVGALVFGRLELMVAEHCVIGTGVECARDCAGCARRRRRWMLLDRKGYEFPVTTDASGRTHLYNAVMLDLSRSVRELLDAGLAALRLELHALTAEEAAEATRAWRRVLDDAMAGGPSPLTPLVEPATSGHFYRGVR